MSAATPERKPLTEDISGLIELTFHNDESGLCVLRVKTQGTEKKRGQQKSHLHCELHCSGVKKR